MTPERWARVQALFDDAVERPPAERAAWLNEACAGDAELRTEVESLLDADDTTMEFLDGEAAEFAAPAMEFDAPDGDAIGNAGPYRLIREIGHGGMSVVYLAERADGAFDQRVAVKLLRHPGGDATDRERRFRAERQILAEFDHPNIARVIDGGMTAGGWPYLAMELVEGAPITTFCESRGLDLDERLSLLEQVCHAVQHAHQRLVVHRDIKPSNILVQSPAPGDTGGGGGGTPKLLDFGIAKLLQEDHPESAKTRTGLLVMTPEYAAPEQVRGEPITTATDVYALGVLLYELLAGRRPHDLKDSTAAEIERSICEVEPPRLTGLPADLDAIAQKALRKEPAGRYASASDLADDLRRYRNGLPVEAQPPSTGYRVRKFVRRHRLGVGIAAVAVLAMIGFGAAMAVLRADAARERDRANAQAEAAEQALSFLTDLFLVSDPDQAQGESMTARDALDAGVRQLRQTADHRPEVRARLLVTIGEVYLNLALYEPAEAMLRECLELRTEVLGPEHPDTLRAKQLLARLKKRTGKIDEALPLFTETFESYRRVLGPGHHRTLATANELGGVHQDAGRFDDALLVYQDALPLARASLGDDDGTTQSIRANLGVLLKNAGRLEEAEPLYREALAVLERRIGKRHPDTMTAESNLGLLLVRQGKVVEAEALFRALHERVEAVLGEEHPQTLKVLNNLATALAEQKRFDEEAELRERVLEAMRRVNGPEHPATLGALNNLAVLRLQLQEYEQAEALFTEVVAGARKVLGNEHPNTLLTIGSLAEVRLKLGRLDEAERMLTDTVATTRRVLPEGHTITGYTLSRLGGLYTETGRYDEAAATLDEAMAILSVAVGEGHSQRVLLDERIEELNRRRSGG